MSKNFSRSRASAEIQSHPRAREAVVNPWKRLVAGSIHDAITLALDMFQPGMSDRNSLLPFREVHPFHSLVA